MALRLVGCLSWTGRMALRSMGPATAGRADARNRKGAIGVVIATPLAPTGWLDSTDPETPPTLRVRCAWAPVQVARLTVPSQLEWSARLGGAEWA